MTQPDEVSVEEALGEAILAVGSAEFVPALVSYMRAIAPFSGVFLTRLGARGAPEHVYDDVRAERRVAVVDQYLDGAWLLDPFVEEIRKDPADRVLKLSDVAPDRFQRSSYYQRYYRTLTLRDEIGVFVRLGDGPTLFYSIGRRAGEPPFRRKEAEALRKALPVIAALNRRHFDSAYLTPAADAGAVDDAMVHFGEDVLTAREREIAGLILKGHSSRSIAELTRIATGTVKIHRKNIYRKLGISSQSELFSTFLDRVAG